MSEKAGRKSFWRGVAIRVAVYGLAAGGAGLGAWLYLRPVPDVAPGVPLDSPYANEHAWLTTMIVRDLGEMAAFAADRSVSEKQRFSVEVGRDEPAGNELRTRVSVALRLGGRKVRVSRTLVPLPSVWSPETYRELAVDLLSHVDHAGSAPGTDDDELLAELLSTDVETFVAANARVSSRLEGSFFDAAAHEQAALLLGAFGMREAAGPFSDLRPTLCRITAHLTLARVLRAGAPAGPSGQYAGLLLDAIGGRGAAALEGLARRDAEEDSRSQARAAWNDAIMLRVKLDWRPLREGERRTPLQRRELFRALLQAKSATHAVEALDSNGSERVPEAGRLASSWGLSVELGHRYLREAVERELAEAAQVRRALQLPDATDDRLVDELNAEPAGPIERIADRARPNVLPWSAWAASYQRHVANAIHREYDFLNYQLGMKEAARDAADQRRRAFHKLLLHPILARLTALADDENTVALKAGAALIRRRPEVVTARAWSYAAKGPRDVAERADVPQASRWFTPGTPAGTAFDVASRLKALRSLEHATFEALAPLKQLEPYDYWLVAALAVKKYTGRAQLFSAAAIAEEFGDRAAYDTTALRWQLKAEDHLLDMGGGDRQAFRRLARETCDRSADTCAESAASLVDRGIEGDAVVLYQEAVDRAPDRVGVANHVSWLMEYYLDQGSLEKALAVARKGAETGAGGGLAMMGRYFERTGRLDEAESYFEQIRERYDDAGRLLAFYHRAQALPGGQKYRRKFEAAQGDIFPNGLERFPSTPPTEAPTDGVLVIGGTDHGRRLGLDGAVIIGLDGWRTRNLDQYGVINAFTRDPEMRLEVWGGGRFRSLKVRAARRRFDLEMRDLSPKRAS